MHRREMVLVPPDPSRLQLHAPGTSCSVQQRILNNSYVSELDLESASERIDLEMAVNLG